MSVLFAIIAAVIACYVVYSIVDGYAKRWELDSHSHEYSWLLLLSCIAGMVAAAVGTGAVTHQLGLLAGLAAVILTAPALVVFFLALHGAILSLRRLVGWATAFLRAW